MEPLIGLHTTQQITQKLTGEQERYLVGWVGGLATYAPSHHGPRAKLNP